MTRFHHLGPDHIGALIVVAGLCVAVLRWGGLVPVKRRGWVRGFLAAVFLTDAAATYIRLLALVHRLRWDVSLPLHLCDLALVICFAALVSRSQVAFELTYYWALTGAVAAMLTPDLAFGFPAPVFLLFFLAHGILVLTIVWLITGEGLRPRPGSAWTAFGGLLVYFALVGALDGALGWNYGYLREKPSQPSLLDHLGPWPWYVAAGSLLALGAFTLLYLPWRPTRVPE